MNSFYSIDRKKAKKILKGKETPAVKGIKFGNHYKLVTAFTRRDRKGNTKLHILWMSLKEQQMENMAAVTLINEQGKNVFWIRPFLGESGSVIKKGEFIYGDIVVPRIYDIVVPNVTVVDQTPRFFGIRLVSHQYPALKVDGGASDMHDTRLLFPFPGPGVSVKVEETPLLDSFTESFRPGKRNLAAACSIENGDPAKGDKFVLITTLYNESEPERVNEYLACFEKNYRHPRISRVIILYDTLKDGGSSAESVILNHIRERKDAAVIYIEGRPTYEEIFAYANARLPGRKIIISNGDIFFNSTLDLLVPVDLTCKFLVLSRWDLLPGKEPALIRDKYNRPNCLSADAWIFQTPLPVDFSCDYQLGTFFCDSFLNVQLFKSGLKVYNPCLDIQACHLHAAWEEDKLKKSRDYSEKNKQDVRLWGYYRTGHWTILGVEWCHVPALDKEPPPPCIWENVNQ